MYTFPDESTATPYGSLNCPSPEPDVNPEHVAAVHVNPLLCVPLTQLDPLVHIPAQPVKTPPANCRTRLFEKSVTYTFPDESTATPIGLENSPSEEPEVPTPVQVLAVQVKPLLCVLETQLVPPVHPPTQPEKLFAYTEPTFIAENNTTPKRRIGRIAHRLR